eukprot:SAG11_NODE_17949_length_504_cov_1.400000_1_plen_132_part_10
MRCGRTAVPLFVLFVLFVFCCLDEKSDTPPPFFLLAAELNSFALAERSSDRVTSSSIFALFSMLISMDAIVAAATCSCGEGGGGGGGLSPLGRAFCAATEAFALECWTDRLGEHPEYPLGGYRVLGPGRWGQ